MRSVNPAYPPQPGASPVFTPEQQQALLARRTAWEERQASLVQLERRLRAHQPVLGEELTSWADACGAEGGDPAREFQYLLRPLPVRLVNLFADPVKGWPKKGDLRPTDRILSPELRRWAVLCNPHADSTLAELVTYLEDVRDEARRWQAVHTNWEVAEAERADAIVRALRVVVAEARDYVATLPGDEPTLDPRIAIVFQRLQEIDYDLHFTNRIRSPRAKPGRPRLGPVRYWSRVVQGGIRMRLTALYALRTAAYHSEETEAHVVARLLEKIVRRLHLADRRGFDARKTPTEELGAMTVKVRTNPSGDLLRKLCEALDRKRLSARSRPRTS